MEIIDEDGEETLDLTKMRRDYEAREERDRRLRERQLPEPEPEPRAYSEDERRSDSSDERRYYRGSRQRRQRILSYAMVMALLAALLLLGYALTL